MKKNNQTHFDHLRTQYPIFSYYHHHFTIKNNGDIQIVFDFGIGDDIRFQPEMILKPGKYAIPEMDPKLMDGIIFHIGLIELISYWKSTCSPVIHIHGYALSSDQQAWWKKLYYKGLGEFFYQNSISVSQEDFVHFIFDEDAIPVSSFLYPHPISKKEQVIVPIGGGKDSVVTLEELRQQKEIIPFIINPRQATLDCARIAGFEKETDIVILKRQIHPVLLQLNADGFLNGHTPFSAMLAFYTLLVAYATGTTEIALSNESSANEPTIPGTEINHQYSKSLEFEQDFQQYVQQYMSGMAHYYSYLRPLNELQIGERFSRYPQYFPVFRSCNVGSKEDRWCCRCPKCLFTAIILAPFIDEDQLIAIFGEDLFDNPELTIYFDELTGIAENKPFECVGTISEVNQAIKSIIPKYKHKYLIQHYLNNKI